VEPQEGRSLPALPIVLHHAMRTKPHGKAESKTVFQIRKSLPTSATTDHPQADRRTVLPMKVKRQNHDTKSYRNLETVCR
jgi:hypothetical protein